MSGAGDEVAELRDGYLADWEDCAHDPRKWATQLELAATDCAMHELRRRKLEADLAEALAVIGEAQRYIDPTASEDARKLVERIGLLVK